jgi:hypothetical protein
MVTAKIGGIIRPWMNRQTTSACRFGANATSTLGTSRASMATMITRRRPSTSAIAPVNGAVMAIASVVAVMTRLMSAGPT